jgi:hypothetical protein
MKTAYILVFVGYACFGVGMLLGEALAGTIWWIVTAIVAGLACILILALFTPRKPRKKKLPPMKKRASRVARHNVRLVR